MYPKVRRGHSVKAEMEKEDAITYRSAAHGSCMWLKGFSLESKRLLFLTINDLVDLFDRCIQFFLRKSRDMKVEWGVLLRGKAFIGVVFATSRHVGVRVPLNL